MRRTLSCIIIVKNWTKRMLLLLIYVVLLKATYAQSVDTCNCVSLGTITFIKTGIKLTRSMKTTLDSAILTINKKSDCKVKVVGTDQISCDRNSKDGQRSWARVNSIVAYLINKGIAENRIIFQSCDMEENSVELRLNNDDLLQLPLQSHPNIRQHKSSKTLN